MEIASFTVNGLLAYARKFPSFEDMVDSFHCDILCMQKILIPREKLENEMILMSKYYSFFQCCSSRTANGGVATFCKKDTGVPLSASLGFSLPDYEGLDHEGKCLVTDHGEFVVLNAYFPTSCHIDKIEYKMWFFYVIQEHLEYYYSVSKKVVLCGDLGFAYNEKDHYDPGLGLIRSGVSKWEKHRGRAWLRILLESRRFVDAHEYLYPEKQFFTYFPTTGHLSQKLGIRIDYFILSKALADRALVDCSVSSMNTAGHLPIHLSLNIKQSAIPSLPPNTCSIFFNEFELSFRNNLHHIVDHSPPELMLTRKRGRNETPVPALEIEDPGATMCFHQEPAQLSEVKKTGKNHGRPFYSCRRPPGNGKNIDEKCSFFKWADDSKIAPKCDHKAACALRKVKKEGRNSGKWYYKCRRPGGDQCDFFMWAKQLNEELKTRDL